MALKRITYTLPFALIMRKRVGRRGGCEKAFGVNLGGTASSADLGGSSKYSNENFED